MKEVVLQHLAALRDGRTVGLHGVQTKWEGMPGTLSQGNWAWFRGPCNHGCVEKNRKHLEVLPK